MKNIEESRITAAAPADFPRQPSYLIGLRNKKSLKEIRINQNSVVRFVPRQKEYVPDNAIYDVYDVEDLRSASYCMILKKQINL